MERLAARPAWVIDGNYTSTLPPRLRAADTVIHLDVPNWRCAPRLLRRILADYGRVRADAAPGCVKRLDLSFPRFAWSWNRTHRTRNLALTEGFNGCRTVVRGKDAVRDPRPA